MILYRFICLPLNSTHLCQPLDVAVFRPAKTEWKDILDTWRQESWCSDNLPKTIFPSLLGKLVKHLKSTNLVSGFCASGLWPLDRNQVLKRLPSCNDTSNINEFSFNELVLKVLKENCGIGAPKRRAKKRGRKVEPGQWITTLIFSSDDENEEPSASGSKQQKKVSKKINLILAKLITTMRKRNANARNVKSFGMIRVVIDGSFAIFVVRGSSFSVQI